MKSQVRKLAARRLPPSARTTFASSRFRYDAKTSGARARAPLEVFANPSKTSLFASGFELYRVGSSVYTVHTQMNRTFVISNADKRPMYLQIMEQIERRVAVGDWTAGQAIPSIRQLAVDIGVSVITVKRAYLELEREGVIVTRQGRGSCVAPDSEVGTRIRERELSQQLEQAARSAALLGLSPRDLEKRVRASYDRMTEVEKESV